MVANFTIFKDYKSYLAAAESILTRRNDVTFLAIGEGENLQKHKTLIKENFKNKIIFTHRQSNIESIINTFSIGVLSTNVNVCSEGISNSIMEYMALGKPVVATNCGGTPELVVDGKTGFLIPPRDPASLSRRILQLLDDPDLAMKMGNEGKKRLQKEFNLEKMTDAYVDLYHKIAKQNHN
jgi:glycosyltransferase involved in cell wall biosynthesis